METKIERCGAVVGLLCVTLMAACGGTSGKGGVTESCGKVQACGGSLAGTWTVGASCNSVTNFTGDMPCAGATIDESMKVTSGTLTFNADMTYSTTVTQSGTMKFTAPLSCTSAASCDELATSVYPMPPDATTTCTATNAACDCKIVLSAPMTATDSGTYTTAGNVLTVTSSSGGGPSSVGYCVQGSELHLVSTDETTGAFFGDVVATR